MIVSVLSIVTEGRSRVERPTDTTRPIDQPIERTRERERERDRNN